VHERPQRDTDRLRMIDGRAGGRQARRRLPCRKGSPPRRNPQYRHEDYDRRDRMRAPCNWFISPSVTCPLHAPSAAKPGAGMNGARLPTTPLYACVLISFIAGREQRVQLQHFARSAPLERLLVLYEQHSPARAAYVEERHEA
jgi:hypothetical protein